jgi:hypothetical protein
MLCQLLCYCLFDRKFRLQQATDWFDDLQSSLVSYPYPMDGRTFTLAEAKQLLPQLEERLLAVKQEKEVLVRSHGEVKRASAKAQMNGGSFAGPRYIRALERISDSVESIQEMGVLVKDLDIGLCDFPYLFDGRVVYLCWKLGESEIRYWHEVDDGYSGRQPIECLTEDA